MPQHHPLELKSAQQICEVLKRIQFSEATTISEWSLSGTLDYNHLDTYLQYQSPPAEITKIMPPRSVCLSGLKSLKSSTNIRKCGLERLFFTLFNEKSTEIICHHEADIDALKCAMMTNLILELMS
jgi:hypothetical protein